MSKPAGFFVRMGSVICTFCISLLGCNSTQQAITASAISATAPATSVALTTYSLTGNTSPIRDPSVFRQGSIYYLFATDAVQAGQTGFLPIRCSSNLSSWSSCGYVFDALPAWISAAVPGATNLWAPDISYFHNSYHLYYAASTLGSQISAIGLATNTTLDTSSPEYKWVDQGLVVSSSAGDDFNAIDPNILVDGDGSVWLTYGSFWTGIKQRNIDPETGKLSAANATTYALAYQPAADHAVEGASLIQHGGYYYLFVSLGHCCEASYQQDDYTEAVGRSTSAHGPFLDMAGVDMAQGGGTVLIQKSATWNAPGGGTAYMDPTGESLLVFHALKTGSDPTGYLWVKPINWSGDWPSLN